MCGLYTEIWSYAIGWCATLLVGFSVYKPHTNHNSSIRSDEGLTLETSAFESRCGGQFTLSTQLIKPNHSCETLGLWGVPWPGRNELRKISHGQFIITKKLMVGETSRLRVVTLSLSPSCVTRKKTERKKLALSPLGPSCSKGGYHYLQDKSLSSGLRVFFFLSTGARSQEFAIFFSVTRDGRKNLGLGLR